MSRTAVRISSRRSDFTGAATVLGRVPPSGELCEKLMPGEFAGTTGEAGLGAPGADKGVSGDDTPLVCPKSTVAPLRGSTVR